MVASAGRTLADSTSAGRRGPEHAHLHDGAAVKVSNPREAVLERNHKACGSGR